MVHDAVRNTKFNKIDESRVESACRVATLLAVRWRWRAEMEAVSLFREHPPPPAVHVNMTTALTATSAQSYKI